MRFGLFQNVGWWDRRVKDFEDPVSAIFELLFSFLFFVNFTADTNPEHGLKYTVFVLSLDKFAPYF